MADTLRAFLETSILWQSLLGTALIGLNFSILGTTLVEKKLSLVGDTFSHAILPGVVISAWLWGSSPESLIVGGWIAGLLLMGLTFWLSKKASSYQESSFAFLAVFFVAIGIVISFQTRTSSEVLHLLLGHVLAFDTKLLVMTLALTALTWVTFFVSRHMWSLWILDPDYIFKQTRAIKALKLLGPFILITNLTFGLHTLGALMTVGLLITPSLTAQVFCVRLYSRITTAAIISVFYALLGFTLSYHWDWPLGPSLVLVSGFAHLLSLFLKSLVLDVIKNRRTT